MECGDDDDDDKMDNKDQLQKGFPEAFLFIAR